MLLASRRRNGDCSAVQPAGTMGQGRPIHVTTCICSQWRFWNCSEHFSTSTELDLGVSCSVSRRCLLHQSERDRTRDLMDRYDPTRWTWSPKSHLHEIQRIISTLARFNCMPIWGFSIFNKWQR
jgi:hypothetical protein